jgi:OPA family glycerol-3-phosphate transporter-like MFS transporter
MEKFAPIAILLIVVSVVISRLPRVEGLGHSDSFRRRRVMNWLPLGLTYAFLYMGRYNIKVSQHAFGDIMFGGSPLMTNQDFSLIFMAGTWVYGCSFLVNGPLTDRKGGRFSILVGAAGSSFMNLLMGIATWSVLNDGPGAQWIGTNLTPLFCVLYAVNMYFQSFGAVAIVKVNASWFHVKERGVFGAIFGILISLGVYFAFDWGYMIISNFDLEMVFLIPTMLLAVFWVADLLIVRNTPGEAGFEDFDLADASSGDDGPQMGAIEVFKLMFRNPVIITIACVEFCSGFLRQAIMQWFRSYAKQTDDALGLQGSFVYENWGMLLCCAGIMGGVIAGILSDRVFQSRRGPVAGILYGGMLIGAIVMVFTYQTPFLPWLVVLMSMCVIGVHGMLSGTASMDFGGKKNVGVAVGIIDGFVYAGTGFMSLTYYFILPSDADKAMAADPNNWSGWPISMVPVALIGLILAIKLWHAKPQPKGGSGKKPADDMAEGASKSATEGVPEAVEEGVA